MTLYNTEGLPHKSGKPFVFLGYANPSPAFFSQ